MKIDAKDRDVLRRLAAEKAEIASLDAHKTTAGLWNDLNGLRKTRPMIWINEIPWHELGAVEDELTLRCSSDFTRSVEKELRQTIYQWRHMPGDMVVEPVHFFSKEIIDSGFGIEQEGEWISEDAGGVNSQEFEPQITSDADVEKIKYPKIEIDKEVTEERRGTFESLFGDILEVKERGVGQQWFALWDILIRWYGVQEAMMDLIMRPELVHACMARLLDAHLHKLRQYEELNLLELDNGNSRIGSGGLGYTDELPSDGFNSEHVRTIDQWGCANAQIFSEVSPEMHEEFALRYDREWLKLFGLTYYGCCEPLHNKIEILRSVPNLRKISVSAWADIDKTVEEVGTDYVLSYKPNPAILAEEVWNPQKAREELVDFIKRSEGCRIEIIMKDVSTVLRDPRRLHEWAEIAMDVAERTQ